MGNQWAKEVGGELPPGSRPRPENAPIPPTGQRPVSDRPRAVAPGPATSPRPPEAPTPPNRGAPMDVDSGTTNDDEEEVPTVFRWEHGGRQVFVTGTFNDWTAQISAEINQCVRPAWRYYLLFWPPRRSARVLGVFARGVLGLLTRTFDFRTGPDPHASERQRFHVYT
jgi:hypothetical protein